MILLQLINGFLWLGLVPLILLTTFLFIASRSPFQAAARVHWLFVVSLLATLFAVIAAFFLPKIISVPMPAQLAEQTLLAAVVNIQKWLLLIYVFGAVWSLSYLFLGIREVATLSSRAEQLHEKRLQTLSKKILTGRHKDVEFKCSGEISSPLIWGWRHPTVLLPVEHQHWSASRLERVLTHELAHISRNDWAIKLLVRIVCSLLWYLPLVWMVARKVEWFAELACDDEVINRFNCRAEYADDLLEISASGKHSMFAMALNKGSMLYARIESVLDGCRSREPWSKKTQRLLLVAVLIFCLPLTTINASIRQHTAPGKNRSQLLYPLIIPRPSADWEGSSIQETRRGVSDRKFDGSETFDPVSTPATFTTIQANLRGQHEEVRVYGREENKAFSAKQLEAGYAAVANFGEFPQVTFSGYLPVKMVSPHYPLKAIEKGIEGRVVVQFDVNRQGEVENIRIVQAMPSRIFDRAVVDAVKQFQFMPLVFQGEAIKTKNVTETFVFQLKEVTTDRKKQKPFKGLTQVAESSND